MLPETAAPAPSNLAPACVTVISGCSPNDSCGASTSNPSAPEQWPTIGPGNTAAAATRAAQANFDVVAAEFKRYRELRDQEKLRTPIVDFIVTENQDGTLTLYVEALHTSWPGRSSLSAPPRR